MYILCSISLHNKLQSSHFNYIYRTPNFDLPFYSNYNFKKVKKNIKEKQ